MKLTGKCKEDFDKWFYDNYPYKEFLFYSDNFKCTYLIEFFDSSCVYVCITPIFPMNKYGFAYSVDLKYSYDIFNTRTEATKGAIIEANEIYNDKHKL